MELTTRRLFWLLIVGTCAAVGIWNWIVTQNLRH